MKMIEEEFYGKSLQPTVPLNSLRYKCLRELAKIITSRKTNELQYYALYSKRMSLDVKSLLVNHLLFHRAHLGVEEFCDLLAHEGNNYSLNLGNVFRIKLLSDNQVNRRILSVIAENGERLQSLRLFHFPVPYSKSVFTEDRRFHALHTLKLSELKSPEDLVAILKSCLNLKRLEVSSFYLDKITLPRVNRELSKDEFDRIRGNMEYLKLIPVSLSRNYGAREAIEFISLFPNLTYLDYGLESILEYIETQLKANPENLTIAIAQVLDIFKRLRGIKYRRLNGKISLTFLTGLFPCLEEILLVCRDMSNQPRLESLKESKNLKQISLTISDNSFSGISDVQTSILRLLGDQLVWLELNTSHLSYLNLIACYCPNIKYLSLSGHRMRIHSSAAPNPSLEEQSNSKSAFSKLLSLKCNVMVNLDTLLFLLSNAQDIEYIEIQAFPGLSDSTWDTLIQSNPLMNLTSLLIDTDCFNQHNTLSKDYVQSFSHKRDKLCFIDCWHYKRFCSFCSGDSSNGKISDSVVR